MAVSAYFSLAPHVRALKAFTPSFKLVLIYLTPRGAKAESTLAGFEPTPVGLNRLTRASSYTTELTLLLM